MNNGYSNQYPTSYQNNGNYGGYNNGYNNYTTGTAPTMNNYRRYYYQYAYGPQGGYYYIVYY